MNQTTIIGNATADVEIKNSQSGTEYAKFSIAVNNRGSTKNTVTYFECVAYNNLAKICSSYIKKGSKVCISGSLHDNSYERKDGSKMTTKVLNVEQLELLRAKREENPEQDYTGKYKLISLPVEDDMPF